MRTLSEVLSEITAAFPDRNAIVHEGETISYRQLDERVDRLARGLIELGVAKGDKVGLWMPNMPEWVIVYFAIARIGAVVVPVNTRYKPHEASYILQNSEATTLFMVDTFVGIDYLEMLGRIRGALPFLKHVIVCGQKGSNTYTFDEITGLGAMHVNDGKVAERATRCNPNDNVFILYTSGTTGNPKGAMLSHHNIAENAKQVTELLQTSEQDIFLLAVPFFHCFGCVMGIMGAIAWGASIVPMAVFKAGDALRLIEQERVSITYGVPTMFVLKLEEYHKGKEDGSAYDISSLRSGIMAGAPCPTKVMNAVITELYCNISIAYGLTEASPVITMTRFDDSVKLRVETVGRALPGIEVKVVDDDRQPRRTGETGELTCRGYNVMLGYYKMPDKTMQVIDGEGWLYSGDLATMDSQGYVSIVGRKKDMLITGGFNVYPAEIEEYLFTHPKVQSVSVIGVDDSAMGEVAVACVIARPGATIDPQEIVDFCAGKIANFKVPRYVAIMDHFPTTQSGKIQKFLLSEQAEQLVSTGALVKLSPRRG